MEKMEKKNKIKSAAGSRATSANIEARLSAKKPKPKPPCPLLYKDCRDLLICASNDRPCSGLVLCGSNF